MNITTKTTDVLIVCTTALIICTGAGYLYGKEKKADRIASIIRADYELSKFEAVRDGYQYVSMVYGCGPVVVSTE